MRASLKGKGLGCAAAVLLGALAAAALIEPAASWSNGLPQYDLDVDKTLSPYFFIEGGDPSVDSMPLEGTAVDVRISGVIADVTVRQRYKNDGTRPLNAVYIFPASTRAAVHGMTMTIGDVVIRAKIKEKQQAKKEYEEAKRKGKSASLLEQERPNVFRMSVANVMPGDRIDIELHYSELLVPTAGIYEFVYPTVVGPRYSEQPEAQAPASEDWIKSPYTKEGKPPSYTLDIKTSVSAGMPIESLACPSHKIVARWKAPSRAEISLSATESEGGDRDYVLHYRLSGGEIRSGLLLHEGEDENFFLMMVQPPKRVKPEQIPPREYVFVVDVSGSMHGFPLNTSKELLRHLIGDLRPTDTFNVIFFSGGSHILSPTSLLATPRNISLALHMMSGQRGGGGTQLLRALKRAMALPHGEGVSRNFVVITDGYISAEKEVFEYIRENLNNANVYSFGIGTSVNRFLIEGIAKAGLGEPFVVLERSLAQKEAARFKSYIESPILTDLSVKYEGFQAYDVEPASLPDVLADRPIIVHGKWKGNPSGAITLRGVSGEGAYRKRFEVSRSQVDPRNSPLRYLWARTKVANISDFSSGHKTEEEREELIRLGLKYSLLTQFTSFIAVHEVIRNVEGPAEDVKQPLPLPKGVSKYAIGVRRGAEPGLLLILLPLGLLFLAGALRRRWVSNQGSC
ncbi:VIT domain-containing protein [Elusimicrobiota bacterium]